MSSKWMKAARFHPVSRPVDSTKWTLRYLFKDTKKVSVDIIEVPTAGDNDILVKIRSASLCHSDLMLLHGTRPIEGMAPVTMGHEGAGYVEAWGKNVTGYAKGDRIGFLYIKGCCCK